MRKSFVMMALTLAVASFAGMGISSANHCGQGTTGTHQRRDDFGSCENNDNQVTCGSGHTDVAGVGYLAVDPATGAQICNDGSGAAPIQGRISAYRNGGGATVSSDGDADNPGGSQSWTRVDVASEGCSVARARRSSGGDAYRANGGGTNTNPPDGGSVPPMAGGGVCV